jgi:hypothetical protein
MTTTRDRLRAEAAHPTYDMNRHETYAMITTADARRLDALVAAVGAVYAHRNTEPAAYGERWNVWRLLMDGLEIAQRDAYRAITQDDAGGRDG